MGTFSFHNTHFLISLSHCVFLEPKKKKKRAANVDPTFLFLPGDPPSSILQCSMIISMILSLYGCA